MNHTFLNKKEWAFHTVIWVGVYVLLLQLVNTYGMFNKSDGTLLYPVTVGTLFSIFLFYSNIFWLMPQWFNRGQHGLYWFFLTLSIAAQSTLEAVLDDAFFVNFYSTYKDEPFESFFFINAIVNAIVCLLSFTYRFTKDWRINEKRNRALEIENMEAQLAFLKSRIDPHFLFNILNSLYASSLQYDAPELTKRLELVSDLMRYMVYDTAREMVRLRQEIDFIKVYIDVSKLRLIPEWQNNIVFEAHVENADLEIPPLLLLPLVENAFKHGVSAGESFYIRISLISNHKKLQCVVENAKPPHVGRKEGSSGFGLDNLRKRLAILFPKRYQLVILDTKEKYSVDLTLQTDDNRPDHRR
jgi:two-component system, LytTR family, sensor kinase